MLPQHISIIGIGLLGGSVALAARKQINGCKITGYAHNPKTAAAAAAGGIVDRAGTLAEAVGGAELVILCSPVGTFERLLGELAGYLAPGTLVSDVGSTKRAVVAAADRLLAGSGQGARFVGSHPMAGSEQRGLAHARADLFAGALCILTPTSTTDQAALTAMEQFWQTLGMRTTRLSPSDHDRMLAEVSHLPHALAAALVAMQSDGALPLAGKGFLDTTRIAAGDADVWRDILLENADNVQGAIDALRLQLDGLSAALKARDADRLKTWLAAAAARRRNMDRPPDAR
jgi:prephenate dehydrogenase